MLGLSSSTSIEYKQAKNTAQLALVLFSCTWSKIEDFAEEEGFEPPVPCGTMVFKTTAFDHSAIPPVQKYHLKRTFKLLE